MKREVKVTPWEVSGDIDYENRLSLEAELKTFS